MLSGPNFSFPFLNNYYFLLNRNYTGNLGGEGIVKDTTVAKTNRVKLVMGEAAVDQQSAVSDYKRLMLNTTSCFSS